MLHPFPATKTVSGCGQSGTPDVEKAVSTKTVARNQDKQGISF